MTPERFRQVKELFQRALDVEPGARAAWLAEHCGDDAELRDEVGSLLAAHAREAAIVDVPAAAYVSGAQLRAGAGQWIGQRLGAYEVTALLGHGGMGEVYRARRVDAEFDKEVAIKLVPAGWQAEFVLQRLRTERQILATLEHPHIARLIDGGASPQGVPYLVMELVDGAPIDRWCADQTRERALDLFRDVCAAVSYAHQRLVVHRDLKPSNILVTADGTVKLLDFGIAKLLRPGAGEITTPAATVMQSFTPGFASPEQVLGRPITTASDIYSLGVLLYLLLAGRSPYRGPLDTTQDAIREICETEPAAPGAGADLDAICLRALRKEPEKRYRSVDELAEDVHRHLKGLPVLARGDRLGYRTGKFLRRHRFQVGAGMLLLASLVGGVVFWRHEARIAELERARAERHFQSVRDLADAFLFKVHDAIAPLPGSTAARGLLVDTGLKYLDTLAREAGGDRALQLDLARAYLQVGNLQGEAYGANTGEQRPAMDSYARAVAMAEGLLATEPENHDVQRTLATALLAESRLRLMFAEPKVAAEQSTRAMAIYERLAAIRPALPLAEVDVARAYVTHCVTLDYTGSEAAANEYAKKGVAAYERLHAAAPDDAQLARKLATAYSVSASVRVNAKRDDAALADVLVLHGKGLAIDEKLMAATHGEDADVVTAVVSDHVNFANINNVLGHSAVALEHAERALTMLDKLRTTDKANAQLDITHAMLTGQRARALRGLGRLDEARSIAAQNVATLQARADRDDNLYIHWTTGVSEEVLGSIALKRREFAQARDYYTSALAHFRRVKSVVSLDFTDLYADEAAQAGLAQTEAASARAD